MPEPFEPQVEVEQDSRFPSGQWTGFFLQPVIPPGKHGMDLKLTFRDGVVDGEGHDRLGVFVIKGRYQVADGRCWWTKRYPGMHDVAYQGYNEGKGIWGRWAIPPSFHGGFHIWPVAMGDPSLERLAEEADVPAAGGREREEAVVIGTGDDDRFGSLD